MKKHIVYLRSYFGVGTREAKSLFALNVLFFLIILTPIFWHLFQKDTPFTDSEIKNFIVQKTDQEKVPKNISIIKNTPPEFIEKKTSSNYQRKYNKPIPLKSPVENLHLDINKVDTNELKKLKGIGSKRALRIVKFRNSLGGFININQIEEVWGMDNFSIQSVIKNSYVSEEFQPQKLKINNLTFKEILRHPYIDYELTKTICNNRPIIDSLMFSKVISPRQDVNKNIYFYLDFSQE